MKLAARLFAFVGLLFCAHAVMAQQQFRYDPDGSGRYPSLVRPAPAYVNARVVSAGVAETDTIPAGVRWVLFAAGCDFHAKLGASAAVPGADVTDGTASELNPAAWRIFSQTQVTVISASNCVITLSYYTD